MLNRCQMDDGSLDETTGKILLSICGHHAHLAKLVGCDMIKEKTLSLTSPPPNNNRLDIDECAISSKHNFPNRATFISVSLTIVLMIVCRKRNRKL